MNDPDKMEKLLQRLEKKMKTIPKVGDKLSNLPVLISLLKSYVQKDYLEIPLGTIIAIVSALLYFVAPFDVFPDFLPFGLADDAIVVAFCWQLVETDVEEYKQWRKDFGKEIL